MPDESYEVLCKPILGTLQLIEGLVTADENESIFDVHGSAKTKDALGELIRIRRSLEQYMGRQDALLYVGFLGHFSAGKTCTINTLLGEKRPTGQNPTDTAITLITHESNSSDIIATHSHGELAIGRILYDKPILSQTVIVDTPGSGDPSIVEEMVRDFLPICDRLIYTFSAASPLDRSDLPVLKKARTELPFIPISIVVTRADEFRIDSLKPLSPENFDEESATKFQTEFSMRLLEDVGDLAVSPEDILLIDNKTDFNIDDLKAIVIPEQEIDEHHAVELHSHKVMYYAKTTRRLRDFFVAHIDGKLEALELFLNSAKTNHANYQDKETMSNSRLTEMWRKAREELNHEENTQKSWVNNLETGSDLADQILNAVPLKAIIDDIKKYIDEYADRIASDICKKLGASLQSKYDNHISNVRRQLDELDTTDPITLSIEHVDVEGFTDSAIAERELPFRLERAIKNLPHDASGILHDSLLNLESASKRLRDRIKAKNFIKATRAIVEDSIAEIRSMLDGFIGSVRLYQSAILAMNTRQLAEEAGIVGMIEELERWEIPSDKREIRLNDIVSKVFPNWNELVSEQDSAISELADDLRTSIRKIADLKSNYTREQHGSYTKFLPGINWLYSSIVISGAIEQVVREFNKEMDKFFTNIHNRCDQLMEEEQRKFDLDKREIRDNRKKRIRKFVFLPIALILLITVLYYAAQMELPNNWAAPIVINVGSILIFSTLSKLWDRSKAKIAKRVKRHIRKRREVMESLVNSRISKFDWSFIDKIRPKIVAEISNKINSDLDGFVKEYVVSPNTADYSTLKEISQELERVITSYIAAAKKVTLGLSEYYARTDLNLGVLAEVSAEIRKEAMEPSFVTLNERNAELVDKRKTLADMEVVLNRA